MIKNLKNFGDGLQMERRPEWDLYFVNILKEVAKRGTCDRGRSGAIMVKDKQILCTGFVGAPSGLPHCDEVGHEMRKMIGEDGKISQHCVRTVHAEQNAICQSAKFGISLKGATCYCTMTPCYTCAKMLINAGIRRVVAVNDYHAGMDTKRIFGQAGVAFEIISSEIMKYEKQ